MAKYLRLCATFLLLLCLSLLMFSNNEGGMVEGKICGKMSKTWSGWCGSSKNCDRQCRKWEKAQHGACHAHFPGRACFCYFNC